MYSAKAFLCAQNGRQSCTHGCGAIIRLWWIGTKITLTAYHIFIAKIGKQCFAPTFQSLSQSQKRIKPNMIRHFMFSRRKTLVNLATVLANIIRTVKRKSLCKRLITSYTANFLIMTVYGFG